MGANQSTGTGGSNDPGSAARGSEVKTCYYELLEVDRQASEDEIKKAYRKKALELHPDRNYGNVEETTKLFAAVQSAYEILSDPQERAWYDTHRDTILHTGDKSPGEHYEHNVRITTADDILRLLSRFHGKLDFSDSSTGFYGFLREKFDSLAREEELACEWEGLELMLYPSFGYANDNYEDVARPFYAVWSGFATRKTFSWEDVYRYSEAPDRRIRRMMEKENQRFRGEAIANFNNAVRSLVAFVKKRDPRFKPDVKTEAERQKALKDASAAQAARSRAANRAKNVSTEVIPDWMKSSGAEEDGVSEDEEVVEEAVREHLECVVCKKSFKSEKQYEAHEKSKKHIKEVQHLRRQMQKEDKIYNLEKADDATPTELSATLEKDLGDLKFESEDGASNLDPPTPEDGHNLVRNPESHVEFKGNGDFAAEEGHQGNDSPAVGDSDADSASVSDDDIYASREEVEDRLHPNSIEKSHPSDSRPESDDDDSGKVPTASADTRPKLGKAKEKRAKKAAQKASTTAGSGAEFKCTSCQAGFPSKSRLFNHIKDFGHAQPILKPAAKGGKGKKR